MGERAKVIINELTALEIIYRPDFNINNFYSSDCRIFINALLKENKKLKQALEYAKKIEKDYKEKFDKAIKRCKQEISAASIQYERENKQQHLVYKVAHERMLKILQGGSINVK